MPKKYKKSKTAKKSISAKKSNFDFSLNFIIENNLNIRKYFFSSLTHFFYAY